MSELPIEIDVAAVQRLLDTASKTSDDSFVLLDVREKDEYDYASIDGSRLLPMSELQQRIGELESLKDTHIVVHCHHGGRSLNVTQFLRQQGFTQVQNMTGGIDDWSLQINADVPRY
jgi:rhodanese-related sulfurtransferase